MEGLGLPGQGGHDKGSFAPWPQEAGECARGLHQPPQLARLPSHDPQDASQQLCVADQGHCPHLPCGQVQVLHSVRRRVQAVGARTVRGQQRRPPRTPHEVWPRSPSQGRPFRQGHRLPARRRRLHVDSLEGPRHAPPHEAAQERRPRSHHAQAPQLLENLEELHAQAPWVDDEGVARSSQHGEDPPQLRELQAGGDAGGEDHQLPQQPPLHARDEGGAARPLCVAVYWPGPRQAQRPLHFLHQQR
mmetsp:Transcript_26475/g.63863  ORF Transcript_26475/g.63863 Transcript_26475/m.63863 type:complete len:246 (-) Transcript_26475:796-1533(-)